MKFGLELEFFVLSKDSTNVIPAYKVTSNTDGNPVIGEIRSGIFDSIIDTVFDLKKKLYLETQAIAARGYVLSLVDQVKVNDDFLRNLRKDLAYINRKQLEVLEEYSVYPKGKTGKMLPRGVYKASLQINISENQDFTYPVYERINVEDRYKYDNKIANKQYSSVFNFIDTIFKLDTAFADDIKEAGRVKGVYAIKDGELGKRIEYRSLPNDVSLETVIQILS